jgi:hypothetical protein
MTTTEQKIEPFAYQTNTIPEVKNDIKKDGEKDNNENDDNKPNVNRKRSRATPEQLAILEATFEKNTSPNSKLREALAERVHMSERSIQIWFQNRRAKVKNTQKRHQQAAFQDQLFKSQFYLQYPGGMYGGYPPYGQPIYQPGMPKIINRSKSIDANMYSQSLNPVPEGSIANPMGRLGFGQAQGLGIQAPGLTPSLQTPTLTPSIEKNYYNFSNKALVIGTWRRIFIPGDNDSLRCCFSIVDKKIRWIIKEQNIRFKVEFPFSSIGQIVLEPFNNNVSTGKLSINLIKLPTFWMETNGPTNSVWNMSGDFTENQQASKVFKHVIEGDYNHLKVEVSSIIRSSIDLQQLCRIVTPTDLLYQQQANHFQRRQSCPAGLLFNPNNQYIAGNRRLSIPSNTNLMTIPQNVVVSGVPMVQQPMIDTTTQMLQNAAVNPLAKSATISNGFVAQSQLAQPVVQKMQLTSPVQANTVTAAGATDAATAAQLQTAAVTIPKPVATNTISLSPAQATKTTIPVGASPVAPLNTVTENTIQTAVAAVPVQATATTPLANTATNVINPLTISSATAATATVAANTATTLASNDLTSQAITKNGGFIMDNLNIMNGAQLADSSTDVLNFINTESTDNTLVDNSLSTLGSNLSLPGTESTTFDLNGIDEQFLLNLDKNFM